MPGWRSYWIFPARACEYQLDSDRHVSEEPLKKELVQGYCISLSTFTYLCKDLHRVSQELHTWIEGCIRSQHSGVVLRLQRRPVQLSSFSTFTKCLSTSYNCEGTRASLTHQGVIKANISLQTTLSVFKLHNRHFSCCDGQDVPQTCNVGKTEDHSQSKSVLNTHSVYHRVIKRSFVNSPVCFFSTFARPSMISLQFSFCSDRWKFICNSERI